MRRGVLTSTVAAAAFAALVVPAGAETLRWSSQGDALTLDPHAQNEGLTNTITKQIYEPLIERNNDLGLSPALAVSWAPINETTWEFKIRQGVKFHDGADFEVEDAVFSLNRAMSETSDYKNYLSSVASVDAIDDETFHIVTSGPNPILPQQLTFIYMADKGWAEANDVVEPQDFAAGEETYAVRNTNGTGPFQLTARESDVRTEMVKFDGYWGVDEYPMQVDTLIHRPIGSAPTRVAALLSGELDFVLDPPVQDLDRLANDAGIDLKTTDENRSIFLGMLQSEEDTPYDNVDGANPLSDKRVRQAMYHAINADAIQRVVMRGRSNPAGIIMPPFVNGYTPDLDVRLPYNVDGAKALLAEAGYPDGFQITLHCPNDRYVNDEGICQAVVGMLGQIGITVDLVSRTKSIHFQELQNREIGFYMLGWGVPTYDSEYIFNFLFHTSDGNRGSWNATGYSNTDVDGMIQGLLSEIDLDKRNAMIADIWAIVQEEIVYLPIHHQVISWAMRSGVDVPIRADNGPSMKTVTFN